MGHKPLYRQIADRIREQIARGELKPGDALPTESALQTEFGVSRVTVRQALRQLVEQQILESIQGSGTYVKEERVNYDIFQLTSFDEKLSDRHVDTHSEVLIFEVIPADDFLQQQLQITPAGSCVACEARALSQAKANGAGRNLDAACVVPGSHLAGHGKFEISLYRRSEENGYRS